MNYLNRLAMLLGCAAIVFGAVSARAINLTNLYTFGGTNDNGTPEAGLVQGVDGNLYGTTWGLGGTNGGTVFLITTNGSLTTLYRFTGLADGGKPFGPLMHGSDSNFYGTTQSGGTSTNCSGGCGTIFRMSSAGTLTTLHEFDGRPAGDGSDPRSALAQGLDGNYYGTTYSGGTNNLGIVYQLTSAGTFTVLHQFSGGAQGANPWAGLVQGGDGNFYGVTQNGGTNHQGTAFLITSAGTLTTLHQFLGTGGEGSGPLGALAR